jgi:hypothetical protein
MNAEHAHNDPYAVHSIVPSPGDDAVTGRVVWAPATSLWQGVMLAGALAAPFAFSWSGLLVFVVRPAPPCCSAIRSAFTGG